MNLKKSASQQKTNVDAIYLSYFYTFNELSNFKPRSISANTKMDTLREEIQ